MRRQGEHQGSTDSPRARGGWTRGRDAWDGWSRRRRARALRCSSLRRCSGRSLNHLLTGLRFFHGGDEELGDAGCAELAELLELLARHVVEEHDAAAEGAALAEWLERAGGVGL